MPKLVAPKGHKEVLKLSAIPGFHAVGGVVGLTLRVELRKSGVGFNARWELRRKVSGRRQVVGLGSFPEVSLQQARSKAHDVLNAAHEIGQSIRDVAPAVLRPAKSAVIASSAPTFAVVAERLLVSREASRYWKSDREHDRACGRYKNYLAPTLGRLPITAVEPGDCVRALTSERAKKAGPQTIRKVKALLRAIFDQAIVRGEGALCPGGLQQ